MKTSDLIARWNDLRSDIGTVQRVDPFHKLNLFVGVNPKGYDMLAIISNIEPPQLRPSKAMSVEKKQREDGKWTLQVSSLYESNQEIFARLCVDLFESTYKCVSERDGLVRIASRYHSWQKLFDSINEVLPLNVLKGMIGELSFIRYLIDKGFSKDSVLTSWQGPSGADRDFVISNKWFEIKTVSLGKDILTVSSLNQLETDNVGYLVVVYILESSKTDSCAKSVASYVAELRAILSDAPEALRIFEEKIVDIGYIDKSYYDDLYFSVSEVNYFKVDESFPKLVTKTVPKQIINAKYDLSIAAISPWKISESNLWN